MSSLLDNKSPWYRSLKWQLVVALGGSVFLAAYLCGELVRYQESRYLHQGVERQTRMTLVMLSAAAIEAVISEDQPYLETIIGQTIQHEPDIHAISIQNESGQTLAHWQSKELLSPAELLAFSREIELEGERFGQIDVKWNPKRLFTQIDRQTRNVRQLATAVFLILAVVIHYWLSRLVITPIGAIHKRLGQLARGDSSGAFTLSAANELLHLAKSVNVLGDTLHSLNTEIAERQRAEAEREALYRRLVDASREAGKAEIATGVLHNVGNVLNSVNVSATLVGDKVRESKVPNLLKATRLLQDRGEELAAFLCQDKKGKQLPGYLVALAELLEAEREAILGECKLIANNVQHIRQIVTRQQSYATGAGVTEPNAIADLIEDALAMNVSQRHVIEIVRDYDEVPPLIVDKHKLLQVIVNLVNNAKQAMMEQDAENKRLVLRIKHTESSRLRIEIADNGVGIAPEHCARMFEYGFTTKDDGHGVGLHTSALIVQDMAGSLTCHSDGPGKGTTFTLELPFNTAEQAA